MTGSPKGVPPALLHNLKHNHVLHERVVLLTIVTEEVPQVRADQRLEVEDLGLGLYRLVGHYGFMETPNVPKLLEAPSPRAGVSHHEHHVLPGPGDAHPPAPARHGPLARVALRVHVAQRPKRHDLLPIPVNRVVELGQEVEI